MPTISIGDYNMGYKNLKFDKDSVFLVTGGAGFIGSNICEALLNMGYQVRCLDNFSTGKQENIEPLLKNKNFSLIIGDIRNYETCLSATKGATYVLHQAAWGSVPRSIAMPLEYEQINIMGTLNMLEASRQNGVKRFVYASSSSVYGDEPNLPKVEDKVGKVLSPYALTKKTDEEYARLYYKLYGLETVGLRYFNVFGRRQDPNGFYAAVIPKFVKQLLKGEQPVINGDGTHSRDFTYIENVIEANLKACVAKEPACGEAFNIAYGGRVYMKDLYQTIADLLGSNIKAQYGPDRPGDIKHSNANINKAKELLDYSPDYSFEDGIKLCVDWYKENLK